MEAPKRVCCADYGLGASAPPSPWSRNGLITCQLTKLESALDTVKKAYPKLMPADAALIATALSLTGRHAIAIYDEQRYEWPDDCEKLFAAMVPELKLIQEGVEATPAKKTAKATTDEEPINVTVGLGPNMGAGETVLVGREDLKTLLSDIVQSGVEYSYSPSDIGWQWALDRVNWNTVAGQELTRRIKVKTHFTEGATGTEVGAVTKKRASKKAEPAE